MGGQAKSFAGVVQGSWGVWGPDSAERLGGRSAKRVVLTVVRSQSVYGIDIDCSRWLGSPRTTWRNAQGQDAKPAGNWLAQEVRQSKKNR